MPGILGITFEEFVGKLQDSNTKIGKGTMIYASGKPCCIAGHALKAMVLDHKDQLPQLNKGTRITFKGLCSGYMEPPTILELAFAITLDQSIQIVAINDETPSEDRLKELRAYARQEYI